jgi:hypothetical protein
LLRSLERKILFFFDQATNEVRQAAVGERDVTRPFEDSDADFGIEAAETSRRGHPTGDSADDDDVLGLGFR